MKVGNVELVFWWKKDSKLFGIYKKDYDKGLWIPKVVGKF